MKGYAFLTIQLWSSKAMLGTQAQCVTSTGTAKPTTKAQKFACHDRYKVNSPEGVPAWRPSRLGVAAG